MKRDSICPVCAGQGKIMRDNGLEWCHNCGPHGMYADKPDGKTTARPDGTPCIHSFDEQEIGRSYYRYTCEHCKYAYYIDSGD